MEAPSPDFSADTSPNKKPGRKPLSFSRMSSSELLKERNVRPSLQRICILDYLLAKRNHPTVSTIYVDLLPQIPTLSRTTVYNTLETLCESGLVITLDVGDGSIHYDADITPHAHFKCEKCGKIFDILLTPEDFRKRVPEGFSIERLQLYAFGLCAKCKRNSR